MVFPCGFPYGFPCWMAPPEAIHTTAELHERTIGRAVDAVESLAQDETLQQLLELKSGTRDEGRWDSHMATEPVDMCSSIYLHIMWHSSIQIYTNIYKYYSHGF